MSRSPLCALALTFLGMAVYTPSAFAAPEKIVGCTTITDSGSYVLTRNLAVATGECLVVAADFVTIDLDGFMIAGPGSTTSTTGIFSAPSARAIVVRNGTVTGFGHGVILQGRDHVVERVRALRNRNGIAVRDSSMVTGSTASNNDEVGISASAGSTVTGNIASLNGMVGLLVECPSNLLGNTATGNGVSGTGDIHLIGIPLCSRAHNVPAP